MTVHDVAAYLQVHEMTVYRWFNKGVLPAFKVGSQWRTKRSALEASLGAKEGVQ